MSETPIYGYVYVIGYAEFPGLCKIGFTKHLEGRIETFECASPFKVVVIHVINVASGQVIETQLHRKFKHKRVKREWFQLDENDIAYIQSINSEIENLPTLPRDPDAIAKREALIKFSKLVANANDFSTLFSTVPEVPNLPDLSSMNTKELTLLNEFLTSDEEIGYRR